jgi:hypothetical protein
MTTFNFYIVSLTETDAKVVNLAAIRLKSYFDRIIQKMNPQIFNGSKFGATPVAKGVTDLDLLVYVVTSSIILAVDPTQTIHSPGGATAIFADGTTLSEVYWPFIKKQKDGAKHIALANLAFHEFAHNKYGGPADDVHVNGGGGILGRPVMPAAISGSHPNLDNETFMASILDRHVQQSTCGLYSEELGY